MAHLLRSLSIYSRLPLSLSIQSQLRRAAMLGFARGGAGTVPSQPSGGTQQRGRGLGIAEGGTRNSECGIGKGRIARLGKVNASGWRDGAGGKRPGEGRDEIGTGPVSEPISPKSQAPGDSDVSCVGARGCRVLQAGADGFVWKKQLSAISVQPSAHDDQSGRAARADGNRARVARGKNIARDHPENRQGAESAKVRQGKAEG